MGDMVTWPRWMRLLFPFMTLQGPITYIGQAILPCRRSCLFKVHPLLLQWHTWVRVHLKRHSNTRSQWKDQVTIGHQAHISILLGICNRRSRRTNCSRTHSTCWPVLRIMSLSNKPSFQIFLSIHRPLNHPSNSPSILTKLSRIYFSDRHSPVRHLSND